MKTGSSEELRAFNIIWNASGDYSFKPEFKAYDRSGRADIYLNFIIGAVHKYYDYSKLQEFFSSIRDEKNYAMYSKLIWLGLESCTFYKSCKERGVLEGMRKSYARSVLDMSDSPESIYERLYIEHFNRILGRNSQLNEYESKILDRLEFKQSMSTDEIISSMNDILRDYFDYTPSNKKESFLKKMIRNRKIIHFGEKQNKQNYSMPMFKRIDIGSAEYAGGIHIGEDESKNRLKLHWIQFKENQEIKEKEYIENFFGTSILSQEKNSALEHILCDGNHKGCFLHFTRGEYVEGREETFEQKAALSQRNKNIQYYRDNKSRINSSINKLTNKIKNTMLISSETVVKKTNAGILDASRVWRNIYINDMDIFYKNLNEDIGDLSVDILLDASASQINRQEEISAQGYIISESLTSCKIPVRVYSFCNMRNYTVINIFRDYDEYRKNMEIFRYYAAGFNRDGLAVRTAIHMMKGSPSGHSILIILSDGRPNDIVKIPESSLNVVNQGYENDAGIRDTAFEVRKGRQKGIPVLCVFTGKDEDVESAKKIYGRSMTRIRSPERFADMVGVLLQNELTNI